jgi:sugar phosphate isomerase/epimerase
MAAVYKPIHYPNRAPRDDIRPRDGHRTPVRLVTASQDDQFRDNQIMDKSKRGIGMALWLLRGRRMADRVQWCIDHGFAGGALLQDVITADSAERAEAAALMRQEGFALTYHGNVHQHLRDGALNEDFVKILIDDVLWWHENAGGVHSCCSDPIHRGSREQRAFDVPVNHRLVELLGEGLGSRGIHVGLENGFGGPGCYQSIEDFRTFAQECAGIPNLAILLDTGHLHLHLQGRPGIGQFIRQIPLPIAEVHVTDNHGLKDEHKAHGTIDFVDMAAGLRDVSYNGPITVEVCVDILSGKYAADIDNAAETSGALEMLARLRQVF